MTTDRSALEAAIDEAPDDASRYAVLGDWCLQQGDPRGELIALQLAGATTTKERRAREEALLRTAGIRLPRPSGGQWRWGFVHTLSFELVRSDAWEEHRDDWTEVLLRPVLEHPSCRFLRALVVDASPGDDTLRFLSQRAPRHLEALSLVCNELDLANAGGALSRLRSLQVSAQLIVPAALAMPRLHELSLPADALTVAGLDVVLQSVPGLQRLTLSSLDRFDREALMPVTRTRITSLTLRAENTTRSAIDALAESPLLETLETLDVSRSGLSEEGAHRVLKLAPKFARLDSLLIGEML